MQLSFNFEDDRVPWFRYSDQTKNIEIIGRGYAFIDSHFLDQNALLAYVFNLIKEADVQGGIQILNKELPRFDGLWALIVVWNRQTVLLAVDRMRGIPLFYSTVSNRVTLNHNAFRIASSLPDVSLSEDSAVEFLLSGFIIGRDTLYENIYQVMPGEIVTISEDKSGNCEANRYRYFHYYPQEFSNDTEEQLEEELISILDAVFLRFRDSYRGQKIILPLSGGFDSRLIAAQLKKVGIDNVLCYTYGYADNDDSSVSKLVAEELGFEWLFFEYNEESWKQALAEKDFYLAADYGCKGVSLPHRADLPCLLKLSKKIDLTTAIFWPGHSIEVPAGSHIVPSLYEDSFSDTDLAVEKTVIKRHYGARWSLTDYFSSPFSKYLRDKINVDAAVPETASLDSPISRHDMFDINNRQSKWIINSVRCYEYFGADWRVQYDYSIIDFFLKVPHKYRFGKRLYINTLREHLFTDKLKPLGKLPLAGHLKGLTHWDFRINDEITTRFLESRTETLRKVSLRKLLIAFARRIGVFPHLENYRYRNRDVDPTKWFAYFQGFSAQSSSLKALTKHLQIDEYLPSQVLYVVHPHLNFTLQLLYFAGVYSLEYLSRVYKNLPLHESS